MRQAESTGDTGTTTTATANVAAVWTRLVRGLSFSHVQAVVGTVAGVVSIAGALFSVVRFVHPGDTGKLVAVVQEAGSHRTVPDATIEVLTPDHAVVATFAPDAAGRAVQELPQGTYVVRVSDPRYAAEERRVQVLPRHTVEITATLHAGSSSSIEHAVNGGIRAIRRAFQF